ncbi:MAG TPA: methyltransferase domain-containing protein [Casimicrobiaceae bacterium]|nr:methyltransferase domain-containing protein [Casimicrobiaceae bacterium]
MSIRLSLLRASIAIAALSLSALAIAQEKKPESAGPYVPTPWVIVDEILKLGGVGPNDYVVDLGSGDGRLVLTAVSRFKAKGGFGVDIEAPLVSDANERARKAGIADRVQFHVRDLFDTNVADASVVTLYLLPTSVPKLEGKLLRELKPGARVVSHDYPFPDWPHDRYVKMDVPEKVDISGTTRTTLYLYTVPARIDGEWELKLPSTLAQQSLKLAIVQRAGGVTAQVSRGERMVPVDSMNVHATDVTITLPAGVAGAKPVKLIGKAGDKSIDGALENGARWRAVKVG